MVFSVLILTALGDEVDMKIEQATEEAQEPTVGTRYNFTVTESIGLGSP